MLIMWLSVWAAGCPVSFWLSTASLLYRLGPHCTIFIMSCIYTHVVTNICVGCWLSNTIHIISSDAILLAGPTLHIHDVMYSPDVTDSLSIYIHEVILHSIIIFHSLNHVSDVCRFISFPAHQNTHVYLENMSLSKFWFDLFVKSFSFFIFISYFISNYRLTFIILLTNANTWDLGIMSLVSIQLNIFDRYLYWWRQISLIKSISL